MNAGGIFFGAREDSGPERSGDIGSPRAQSQCSDGRATTALGRGAVRRATSQPLEAADGRALFPAPQLENKRRALLRRPRRLLRPLRNPDGRPTCVLAVFFCESPFPVLIGTVFASNDDDAAWALIGLSVAEWSSLSTTPHLDLFPHSGALRMAL
jgi:hypothetical protein